VQHLSGSAGIERMEFALSDTRSKFFEAKDNETPSAGPVAHVSLRSPSGSSVQPLESVSEHAVGNSGRSNRVVRSLFGDSASSVLPERGSKSQGAGAQSRNANGKQLPTENELLVNEIVHGGQSRLVDTEEANIKVSRLLESVFSITKFQSFFSCILKTIMIETDKLLFIVPLL